MKLECSVCKSVKPGARLSNEWVCDSCMNRPARTRRIDNSKVSGAETKVAMNKVVIQDDDEDGPVIVPPSDGNLHDVSEAEIEKAKAEQAKDSRKYAPQDERTLKRIGAEMVGEADAGTETKLIEEAGRPAAVAAGVKGAGRPARSVGRAKTRRATHRRAD